MTNRKDHLGFYKHDNLPHFDRAGQIQFITFVMADAVPARVRKYGEKLTWAGDRVFLELDEKLDAGNGSCLLANVDIADYVRFSILSEAGKSHHPIAWVVMPNHVHLITKQMEGYRLGTIVKQIKAGSSLLINKAISRSGQFWQHGYFDRAIRDIPHLAATIDYVHYNPVKAGLCERESEWLCSSIHEYSEAKVMQVIEGGILPM